MSNEITKRLLDVYLQRAEPMGWLTGFFRAPQRNFFAGEKVQVDVRRWGESISVPVPTVTSGYRMNSQDQYTSKEIEPAVHMEAVPIESGRLFKRRAGQDNFTDPNYAAAAIDAVFDGIQEQSDRIQRSIELQASQVLQTGTVDLKDSSGTTVYSVDYKPKASHFATVGTSWASATTAQKLADIETALELCRTDGKKDPNVLIMGRGAYENLISDTGFQTRLDNRRIEVGSILAEFMPGAGATFRGTIDVGHYRLEIWTYTGRYEDPQTSTVTEYIDPGKFIAMSTESRFDACFGAIPHIGKALGVQNPLDLRLPALPNRLSFGDIRLDLFINLWMTPDGHQMYAGVGSRPLMVPTAIDQFACFDTQL